MLSIRLRDNEGDDIKVHRYNDYALSQFKLQKEGIAFFDPDLGLLRCVTWDKISEFSLEVKVNDEMVQYAKDFKKFYSDKEGN